ncbi:MAG: DNA replication and repair protein RecF [Acidobacteriota bacterium]
MLSSLHALQFRNLEPVSWQPGAGCHLLFGGNGAGKTSVLEAIYLLATTKSFRTQRLADCIQRGAASFELTAEVDSEVPGAVRRDLAVSLTASGDKQRRLDGKAGAPLSDHLAALPVVSWTAADADLFTGPPEARRRFLDRGVIGRQPGSVEVLVGYRRALSHKRRLLSDGDTRSPLRPWNEILAVTGAEIIHRRRKLVERLAAALAERIAASGLDLPSVKLTYRPSPKEGSDGPLTSEGLLDRLTRLERTERERGQPVLGPHRDDLVLSWDGHPLRGSVSAGERKTLGLMMTAAQGRVMGTSPLYLLDDLDAELAPPTLAAVWSSFIDSVDASGQVLASSNRPEVWASLNLSSTVRVHRGRLAPEALPNLP